MTRSTRAELVGRSEQDDYQRLRTHILPSRTTHDLEGECYAGRVVGCSQGSSADAIRYPRGMEQSG